MKLTSRILIGAGCFTLLLVSWVIAINSKSDAEKQIELIQQATELMKHGIYISAVPLLEEAAGYNAAHTLVAETELKKAYLALIDKRGFNRKYVSLLEKQMNRRGTGAEVFAEAANYYIKISRLQDALGVLKTGIEKTGSDDLFEMYENNRYAYEMTRTPFDYIAAIYGGAVQVCIDGLWGIARANGTTLIPCEYERVSTFSTDRAIVEKGGEIYAVDRDNNRVSVLRERAVGFGNFADNRIPLLIDGSWRRATGDFILGAAHFEQLGMYSDGYAAAKTGGKWGVIDLSNEWLVPPEYDEIIQDELGRCYAQGAVFARKGGAVYLIVRGQLTGDYFEDARPFSNEGYAAVLKNGKWGFIDANGIVIIDFVFDDALSFGQHLAAVKWGEHWGYVSRYGRIAIEPVFLEAKSFSNGSAPVLTERGWQFITLLEYKKGVSL